MKNKYLLLLKIQLYHSFGINRILHSHSKKEKVHSKLIVIIAIFLFLFCILYSTLFSQSMAVMGLSNLLPAAMILICSIMILILTFLKSTGVLIGLRDYDMIMSLPVKSFTIVLSRLSMVYLLNLAICMIAVLPAIVIYGIDLQPELNSYLIFIGSIFFIPIIPMIVSLSIGTFITAVSVHFKYKNIFSLFLSTISIILIIFGSSKFMNINSSEFIDIGVTIANAANHFYPPARMMSIAVLRSDWFYFFEYAGISIFIGISFVVIVSYFYKRLNTLSFSQHTAKYKAEQLQVSSPKRAMYKREFLRYFSCPIYALNSSIGIVLLFIIALILQVISPELLEKQSGITGLSQILKQFSPMMAAVFVSMTSTASASLSLEGKNRWIICSAPVEMSAIFNAKIAVNLTVIFPFLFMSVLLIGIKMKVNFLEGFFLLIVPVVYAFYISILGMFLNVKFPKYDWTSEYFAVKNSLSVLTTIGIGMISSIIPLFLCMLLPNFYTVIMGAVIIVLFLISILLYKKLNSYHLFMI